MSDRQSIIGFTEAELGFFLALLCLILFVVAATPALAPTEPEPEGLVQAEPVPPEPVPSGVTIPEDSLSLLISRLALLEVQIDSLEAVMDTLRDRRSRIAPSCVERRIAEGPLFTVAVVAPDRFRLGHELVSMDALLARTEHERATARRAGCIHQIRVAYLASLSASELDAGWTRLGSQFRLIRIGPVQQ
jgi:hypothetical protein